LHNGLGLTPAAAVRLARRHARPINALGDDQPTLSALYYDLLTYLLYIWNHISNIQLCHHCMSVEMVAINTQAEFQAIT